DVSIRLSILNLLSRLQREDNLGVLYITHDLATARHFSDEILVMYKGTIVERGPSDEVILNPQHDYTKLLLSAAPVPANHGKLRESVRAELEAEAHQGSTDHDQFGTRGLTRTED
ncbi:MAG: ABC transporter ATP-binding protein, partial [Acidipropionibacterium jensenii]|nr:ABC transporter ATP-binding protein [Acidipropionibacterium jensenii]